ncbi:MAG: hypothetical protein JW828_16855, partial [Sedimentisphaerales bacterium]|nr:hypothetical protein [Sedimentisphaerales bacterium]
MQDTNTFLVAGWDFPATWHMPYQSTGYPMLWWQKDIPGDLTDTYGVNMADFAELASQWNKTGCPLGCEDADIDGDGSVDLPDLMQLAGDWLQGL